MRIDSLVAYETFYRVVLNYSVGTLSSAWRDYGVRQVFFSSGCARAPAKNSDVFCLPDLSLTEKRPMPAKVFFDTNVLIYAVAEAIRATFWGERDTPSRPEQSRVPGSAVSA